MPEVTIELTDEELAAFLELALGERRTLEAQVAHSAIKDLEAKRRRFSPESGKAAANARWDAMRMRAACLVEDTQDASRMREAFDPHNESPSPLPPSPPPPLSSPTPPTNPPAPTPTLAPAPTHAHEASGLRAVPKPKRGVYSEKFETFWALQKWQGSKAEAWAEFRAAGLEYDDADYSEFLSATKAHIENREAARAAVSRGADIWVAEFPHACRWISKARWQDNLIPLPGSQAKPLAPQEPWQRLMPASPMSPEWWVNRPGAHWKSKYPGLDLEAVAEAWRRGGDGKRDEAAAREMAQQLTRLAREANGA